MTLIEQIKIEQIAARKAGETKASLLTTLLGEAAMVGKNAGRETTDAEVVTVVKKFIKNINETIVALTERNQDASAFLAERIELEKYLPIQLTEGALRQIAGNFKDCDKGMPDFMKHLKEHFAGQYDGKLASTVAKEVYAV